MAFLDLVLKAPDAKSFTREQRWEAQEKATAGKQSNRKSLKL